mmetsp:Transcript_32035/g.59641  ORF Transcript_32035/g.59641 Transcript_32035/m.59641 type:complete len:249 (+) Transcript_32035:866-1612(+)
MTSLVVCDQITAAHERRGVPVLFDTDENAVNGRIDVGVFNDRLVGPGGVDGSLVHESLKGGTRESRRTTSNRLQVNTFSKRLSTSVHLQDGNAALEIRETDLDAAIETARTEESRVKNVGTVGGSENNDSGVTLETVHLGEDLVQSLFTLVVTSGNTGTTLTTNRINLINEDDARGVLLRHVEEITDAGSSDTNEKLNELRTGGRNERHSSFSGGSTSEKSLTGTGRTLHNNTLRDLGSELSELFGVL